jgi:hypothetical protein
MTSPFEKFNAAVCNDQIAEKLRHLLQAHAHDGSELDSFVNVELPGPCCAVTAANIKHAIRKQYQDCIRIDEAVEIVLRAVERTWAGEDEEPE